MTPITIEPNSGVKMAGVKIKQSGWNVDCYEEIVFIASSSILLRDKNGIESLCRIDCRDGWLLYEEPTPEVKWAPAAVRLKGGVWCSTYSLYKSFEDAENHMASECDVVWPARFDAEGYLIVPEEFK